MAYFDNGNYNFDDLFNELNRDFFNDGRMSNGQQPMRYSAGQAPQQGAQNGQQQKEKPIGVDLTELEDYWAYKERQYDLLADHLRGCLDIPAIYQLMKNEKV